MKKRFSLFKPLQYMFVSLITITSTAQKTYPVNGVADIKDGNYAFTNATIVKDANTTIQNATLIIKQGKIVNVGTNLSIPSDVVTINCEGKFIYPSFIDIFSDYGIATPQRTNTAGGPAAFFAAQQINSATKGAFGWNQAIKSETEGTKLFSVDNTKAKTLRDIGFGAVVSHQKDGSKFLSMSSILTIYETDRFLFLNDFRDSNFN